ncbi:hypothetical protein JOM56_005687 [Amanita muscaria]
MVKSKGKKTDTGQKTDMEPPTIQVDEAPHKESFRRRTKEKVHNFLTYTFLARTFDLLTAEHLPVAVLREGGVRSVGKKMAEGTTKPTDQTSPESIGKTGEAADVTAVSVTELKTSDKATVQTAIKEAQEQVQIMHTLSGGLQTGAKLGTQANTVLDKVDTVSNLLQPLKVFDSVIKNLGDLHPYAKIALSVLSWASQVFASTVLLSL